MKCFTKILVGSTISGSFAGVGQAAVVIADFSSASLTITQTQSISIDFDTGSASTSTVSGEDARLSFNFGSGAKPLVTANGDWRIPLTSLFAKRYASGDVIPDLLSSASSSAQLDSATPTGSEWNQDAPGAADGIGYLGFDNPVTGNQAWLYINYSDTAPLDANNTIRLLGLGFNDAGNLNAGVVPEPSASTLALLAGSVLAFKRRRRISA